MIHFKKITMEDREWIEEKLRESDYRGCDYAFGNIYIWRKVSQIQIASVHGMFCMMSKSFYNKETIYTYPAGRGDTKKVIEEMMQDAIDRGHEFYLRGIEEEDAKQLKEWFPDKFRIEETREESDYIYTVQNLTLLAGKKYHGKRNHIARFRDSLWHYENMDDSNIKACREMNAQWCENYGCLENEECVLEQCAVREAFAHFNDLGLIGGVLYQNNRVVAFTIGETLNSDTFVVHIEKAFSDVQGAYPAINQQFVEHNMSEFLYVNREEDLGKDGLRKAKLSYKPEFLLKKYTAKLL